MTLEKIAKYCRESQEQYSFNHSFTVNPDLILEMMRKMTKLIAVARAAEVIDHDTECGDSEEGRDCWCGAHHLKEALEDLKKE